jgi:hypothetical protein
MGAGLVDWVGTVYPIVGAGLYTPVAMSGVCVVAKCIS